MYTYVYIYMYMIWTLITFMIDSSLWHYCTDKVSVTARHQQNHWYNNPSNDHAGKTSGS